MDLKSVIDEAVAKMCEADILRPTLPIPTRAREIITSQIAPMISELEELVSAAESRANERGRTIHELRAELDKARGLTIEQIREINAAGEKVGSSG